MRVNVDEQAINEPRIRRMARRLSKLHGRPIHHTEILGRLIGVWMLCYSRRSPVLRADDIDITSDLDGFAEAMIGDEMADATHADGMVHVRGVADRIAFLERQSDRGRKGGVAPRETTQSRLFADDEALAKRVLDRTEANARDAARRRSEHSLSERLRSPQANSPAPDQALAPDLDQSLPPAGAVGDDGQPARVAGNPSGLPQDDAKQGEATEAAPQDKRAAKGKREPKPYEPPDQAVSLAFLLAEKIIENHPNSRFAKQQPHDRNAAAMRWAKPIDDLHRLDKFEWGEIQGMIEWCQRDGFWLRQIQGGDNLRDKWDRMAMDRKSRHRGGTPGRPQQSAFDVLDEWAADKTKEQQP